MRPILAPAAASVNQRLPSRPVTGNSVTSPSGVTRPIFCFSVNQTLPSGPFVTPAGALSLVGIEKYVTTPVGVMRQILLVVGTENQTLPSAPAAMSPASAVMVCILIAPAGVMRPIAEGLN